MTTTIEPGKRVARTAVAIIAGGALAADAVVPLVLQLANGHIPSNYYAEANTVGGAILAGAAGINALMNTPLGQKVLGWFGLDATAVQKDADEITSVATDIATGVQAVEAAPVSVATDLGTTGAAVDAAPVSGVTGDVVPTVTE